MSGRDRQPSSSSCSLVGEVEIRIDQMAQITVDVVGEDAQAHPQLRRGQIRPRGPPSSCRSGPSPGAAIACRSRRPVPPDCAEPGRRTAGYPLLTRASSSLESTGGPQPSPRSTGSTRTSTGCSLPSTVAPGPAARAAAGPAPGHGVPAAEPRCPARSPTGRAPRPRSRSSHSATASRGSAQSHTPEGRRHVRGLAARPVRRSASAPRSLRTNACTTWQVLRRHQHGGRIGAGSGDRGHPPASRLLPGAQRAACQQHLRCRGSATRRNHRAPAVPRRVWPRPAPRSASTSSITPDSASLRSDRHLGKRLLPTPRHCGAIPPRRPTNGPPPQEPHVGHRLVAQPAARGAAAVGPDTSGALRAPDRMPALLRRSARWLHPPAAPAPAPGRRPRPIAAVQMPAPGCADGRRRARSAPPPGNAAVPADCPGQAACPWPIRRVSHCAVAAVRV